jgi:hypothetical protein
MGQTVVLFSLLYPSMVKSPIHLSRLFRRGNGGVDLAIHMSAPRVLRLPLRMRIEEAWRIFLTGCAGHAVKLSQWPAYAAWVPPGVWSCQCQAISATGCRDNSREQRVISDVTSGKVSSFIEKIAKNHHIWG